jgi:serine/threonine protein kinase
VKRLLVGNPKAFKHESTILQKLQREPHSHPHLITLLATFEQRKHQYLIFPWAQSDLKDYWMREDQVKDGSFSIWLVRQCQGLVEALSRIHRYETTSGTTIIYQRSDGLSTNKPVPAESRTHDPARSRGPLTLHGRHGDIKPQNILWYHNSATTQDFGTMKLADFGSARFGDAIRMTEVKKKSMAISRTYLSPECQMPDGQPSIQCDIWALGCVFLEFICWYFTGHAGLKTFEDQRNVGYDSDSFFHIVRHGKTERSPQFDAILKETVIEVNTKYNCGNISTTDLDVKENCRIAHT